MALPQIHIQPATPMGANLVDGGATFRVWAPAAEAVHVVGRFNGQDRWLSNEDNRLLRGPSNHWAGFMAGARDGDPYKFYVKGLGSQGYKRDPYARELANDPPYPKSNCVIRSASSYPWHDHGWRPPAFNDLVVYQLHVGTFWGPDVRRQAGTFLDVIDRLGYLADLGINAIEPLPIGEFAAPRSRGYGGSDLFSPEMDYTLDGDLADSYLPRVNAQLGRHGHRPLTAQQLRVPINQLKALVDLCHLNGMAVLFDVVFNHAGSEVRGQEEGLWFFDRATGPDGNISQFFTNQDWTGPVFAFWKEEVRQFLIDNATFFIDEYHADGFRFDEASVIDRMSSDGWHLLQNITATVRVARPQAVQIAEFWPVNPHVVRGAHEGGAGFDATWDDGLRDAVRRALKAAAHGRDAHVDLHAVAAAMENSDIPVRWKAVECVENHDEVYIGRGERIATMADGSNRRSWYARSRARVATGLLLTAPGIPMLFMGQEVLEDKQWSDDPGNHPDTLIHWVGLEHGDRAMVDHLRFTRELISLRGRHPALRAEGFHVISVDPFNRVLAFQRWVEGIGRDVVVVASLNESILHGYRIGMPRAGFWSESFNSDVYDNWVNPNAAGNGGSVASVSEPLHGLPASAALVVPANGVVVLTSDRGD